MESTAGRIALAVAQWCLMAMGLLGCLVMATPMYNCGGKAKAYVTAMKSDLRNLASAQEAFHDSTGRYASDAELRAGGLFRSSTGVNLLVTASDRDHWSARTTHSQIPGWCTAREDSESPICDGLREKARVAPEVIMRNLTLDFWLFAFSISRRRRRMLAHEKIESDA